MPSTRSLLIVALLAALMTGCSGSNPDEAATEPQYARSDLARFTTVPPEPGYWQWPTTSQNPPPPYTREALDRYEPEQPSQTELAEAHRKAGFVESRTRDWVRYAEDAGPSLKASSFATLFETSEGAAEAIGASEAFAHRWFTEVESTEIDDVSVDDLGDGAWGVYGNRPGASGPEFVELGWRRGNVLFEVYVSCTATCPSSVEDAARSWAQQIEETT